MDEYSRILIEEYCMNHKSNRSRRLSDLLQMSYDASAMPSDDDAIFLEKAVDGENNPELKAALEDLDRYLFA